MPKKLESPRQLGLNKKKKSKVPLIILLVMLGLLVMPVAGFLVYSFTSFEAEPSAVLAMGSSSTVTVVTEDDLIIFKPANPVAETALVFYPGLRIDYRAYASSMREIAENGYYAVIVGMFMNNASLGADNADKVLPKLPHIKNWVIGGHSVGGTMASYYAVNHNFIDGIVFWGAYATNDLSLSNMKALSVTGSTDKIAPQESVDEAAAFMPAESEYVVIEGGNNSGFASISSLQNGEDEAEIAYADQQKQAVKATLELLAKVSS